MSTFNRPTDRLTALRQRARRLPAPEGELGAKIEATSPEPLMERNPRTTGRRVDAVNIAVTCGEITDGHGSAGCLAELAIRHCP